MRVARRPHAEPRHRRPRDRLRKDTYIFERDTLTPHEGGTISVGKVDLYKEGHFILEAKQGSEKESKKVGTARRETPSWTIAMNKAYGQGLGYAKTFDRPPPFLMVCDIGYCFDLRGQSGVGIG